MGTISNKMEKQINGHQTSVDIFKSTKFVVLCSTSRPFDAHALYAKKILLLSRCQAKLPPRPGLLSYVEWELPPDTNPRRLSKLLSKPSPASLFLKGLIMAIDGWFLMVNVGSSTLFLICLCGCLSDVLWVSFFWGLPYVFPRHHKELDKTHHFKPMNYTLWN